MIQTSAKPMEEFLVLMRSSKSSWQVKAASFVPSRAFFMRNKATFARLLYEGYIYPLKQQGRFYAPFKIQRQKMLTELKAHRDSFRHPAYLFAGYQIPTFTPAIDLSYRREAIRRQAVLACALERFFIRHQSYPVALAELVPDFIRSVPADPIDAAPMRYRQTQKGRYRLWCIGFDEKDDSGEVRLSVADSEHPTRIYRPHAKGDWAWQYEEVKAR
jgi:hypothetical protein